MALVTTEIEDNGDGTFNLYINKAKVVQNQDIVTICNIKSCFLSLRAHRYKYSSELRDVARKIYDSLGLEK